MSALSSSDRVRILASWLRTHVPEGRNKVGTYKLKHVMERAVGNIDHPLAFGYIHQEEAEAAALLAGRRIGRNDVGDPCVYVNATGLRVVRNRDIAIPEWLDGAIRANERRTT